MTKSSFQTLFMDGPGRLCATAENKKRCKFEMIGAVDLGFSKFNLLLSRPQGVENLFEVAFLYVF